MTSKRTIVVSVTLIDAQQLAHALGITDAVLTSLRSKNFRGIIADRIIVDDRCWPLDAKFREELWHCLDSERGSVLIVRELDMKFWRNYK